MLKRFAIRALLGPLALAALLAAGAQAPYAGCAVPEAEMCAVLIGFGPYMIGLAVSDDGSVIVGAHDL